MNYIIYDIEATCWQGRPPNMATETIEIGAYLMNDYGEAEDKFSKFIRPVTSPYLSAFCLNLTGITQQQVERAKIFPDVIEEFQDWFDMNEDDYVLCSWGGFDKKQLRQDCKLHRLDTSWLDHHIDLKSQYSRMKRFTFEPGLLKTIEMEGFNFDGPHHRAISDAYNLAKIFKRYMGDWKI
jgi:3'-5' exoribonuclease 1